MTRICNLVVFCCAEIEKVGSVDFFVSRTVSGECKESQGTQPAPDSGHKL